MSSTRAFSVANQNNFDTIYVKFTSFEIEMLFAVVIVTYLDLHVWVLMFEEMALNKEDDSFAYMIKRICSKDEEGYLISVTVL